LLLPEFFNPAGMIHAGLVLDGYGAIGDHVRLAEIADPFPGPDGVGIQIHAASINPIDFKIVHADLKRILNINCRAGSGSPAALTYLKAWRARRKVVLRMK
jgi:hypothetical protein